MLQQPDKYNRAIVFSGGGTRFGIYCGMFAAMEDLNITPNLIIGACGGAIATTIIRRFPDNERRKQYLQSEELYEFIRSIKLTNEKMLYRIGWLCLRKIQDKRTAPYIENVFDRYLVEMPEDLSIQLSSLSSTPECDIHSIIIGSKILFEKADAGKERKERKLYRKVLFTDKATARNINRDNIKIKSNDYTAGAIDPSIDLITDTSMLTAMRISISDMFYVSPVYNQGDYFAGGAIDLIPVELAQAMANTCIIEQKHNYTPIEEALVRAVLGYSGNERLRTINNANIDYRIDTTDATQILRKHYCRKTIDWLKLQVGITLPASYQQFVEDIEVQWQYGYKKVMKRFNT